MTPDEEFEQALNIVAGGPPPPMFTPSWWKRGYGAAYIGTGKYDSVDAYLQNYYGYNRWVRGVQERNQGDPEFLDPKDS